MKKIISLIFAMQILTCLSAQTSYYYSSNAGDSVVICGDTVFYKIFNDDGLASFDIGKGVFRHKKSGDLIMKERIPLEWESSILTMAKQNSNNIAMRAYYYDAQPARFASFYMYLDGKEYLTSSFNKDGIIELDEETSAFIDGKEIVVRILIVGFETCTKLNVQNGASYVFKSKYPDYYNISHDEKVKITYNKDGSINFLRGKNKRSAMSLKKNKLDPTVAF